MTSDLAKALEGAPLSSRDDAFLVTHLLAGAHELKELEKLIADLQARRDECEAAHRSVGETLCERHPKGVNFAAHGSLVAIPGSGRPAGIRIAPLVALA